MPFAIPAAVRLPVRDPLLAAAAAAGGAVSIPIIIHLLNRKRFRIVPWAAMRFLLAAQRKTSPQGAPRTAPAAASSAACWCCCCLLAMGSVTPWAEAVWRWFAPAGRRRRRRRRPRAPTRSSSWTARSAWASRPATRTASTRPRRRPRQIVKESNGGDGFSVVLLAAPPRMIVPGPTEDADPGSPSEDAEKVLGRIDAPAAAPTATPTSPPPSTPSRTCSRRRRRNMPKKRSTSSRICSAPPGWPAQPSALAATVQKIQARASTVLTGRSTSGQDGAENLAVAGLALADPVAVAGQKTLLQAVLHNYGDDARPTWPSASSSARSGAEGQPPELREVGATPTVKEIKDGEQVRVAFEYAFPEPGDYVVQVGGGPRRPGGRRRPPRRGDGQGHACRCCWSTASRPARPSTRRPSTSAPP